MHDIFLSYGHDDLSTASPFNGRIERLTGAQRGIPPDRKSLALKAFRKPGRERTASEYEALLVAAGFRLQRVIRASKTVRGEAVSASLTVFESFPGDTGLK